MATCASAAAAWNSAGLEVTEEQCHPYWTRTPEPFHFLDRDRDAPLGENPPVGLCWGSHTVTTSGTAFHFYFLGGPASEFCEYRLPVFACFCCQHTDGEAILHHAEVPTAVKVLHLCFEGNAKKSVVPGHPSLG